MNIDKEIAECYQQLSDHLANEHGLILINSELDEIIRLAQITVANYDKQKNRMLLLNVANKPCRGFGKLQANKAVSLTANVSAAWRGAGL